MISRRPTRFFKKIIEYEIRSESCVPVNSWLVAIDGPLKSLNSLKTSQPYPNKLFPNICAGPALCNPTAQPSTALPKSPEDFFCSVYSHSNHMDNLIVMDLFGLFPSMGSDLKFVALWVDFD